MASIPLHALAESLCQHLDAVCASLRIVEFQLGILVEYRDVRIAIAEAALIVLPARQHRVLSLPASVRHADSNPVLGLARVG
jgi:hypothetical protein